MAQELATASSARADIWRFYSLDEDGLIPCHTARRLLLLLQSPSTKTVERCREKEKGPHEVCLLLTSSLRTDDGGTLCASYLLTREEVHDDTYGMERFTAADREALGEALFARRVCASSPNGYVQPDTTGHKTRDVLIRLALKPIYTT